MAKRPYAFAAIVRRTVLDNIRFTVRAPNAEEARDKAEKFLSQFPDKTTVDGIDYAYIENRENMESEVVDLSPDKGN